MGLVRGHGQVVLDGHQGVGITARRDDPEMLQQPVLQQGVIGEGERQLDAGQVAVVVPVLEGVQGPVLLRLDARRSSCVRRRNPRPPG